ncbi:MAG: rhomboid family intramembrane serine protease [Actinomycetia bacterium]|nr:rhomboid family intramembrane serine protease [Actinomycetes bacterium]MCP3911398.1 rhomboid family intramembrane serine protease [Actinomycetes bacterium]MCP4084225.1 rhomboid family intramembrane serine protease [Actinomycetes bacterium]
MLPLKDENPTTRTPVLTVGIIVACVLVWFGPQAARGTEIISTPAGAVQIDSQLRFSLEYAAIPCEIQEGRPLEVDEIAAFNDSIDEGCNIDPATTPPFFPDKQVWLAMVVSIFLHGGLLHLGGNMLFLWIFGNNIEDHLGHARFALFYLGGGIAATLAHVAAQPDSTVPLVGASGAIAAIMGAYLVWFPDAPIRTLVAVFIFDIRARWYLTGWFIFQFFTAPDSSVAWVAHVGGFMFGVAIGLLVRASRSARRGVFTPEYQQPGWDPTGGAGTGPYPHPHRGVEAPRFGDRHWH